MQPFVCSFILLPLAFSTVLGRPGLLLWRQDLPDDGPDQSPEPSSYGLDPVTDPSSLPFVSGTNTQSDTPITSENPGGPIVFPSSTPSINPGGPIIWPTSSPVTSSPYWISTGSSKPHSTHSIPLAPGPVIPSRSAIPSKPVATICPIMSALSASSDVNATSAMLKRQDALATPTQNVTAVNTLIPATFTVNGSDGCQTLYTPVISTPTCSTTLKGMGQLPITVTNCSQYVTFSTSTEAPASATGTATSISGAPMGDKVAYFLAPWQVVANGSVPSQVTVEDCVDGQGGETCSTSTESWIVVTKTKEAPLTTSIHYSGTITGPAELTLASSLFTTSIPASMTQLVTIETVITTSTPSAYLSIERMPASMVDDGDVTTVYVQSTFTSTVGVADATATPTA